MYGDCCLACVDCWGWFCIEPDCDRYDSWGDPVERLCGDCNEARRVAS